MNKSVVMICVFIGALLAASLWLPSKNKASSYNSDSAQKVSKSEAASTITDVKVANIKVDNVQPVDNNFARKTFQPKTEWSDKTINFNGTELSYKFGEGNPSAVALPPEQYLPKNGEDGIPYVTAKAEYQLKAFLLDKSLPELLDKCVNYLNATMIAQNPQIPVSQMVSVLENKDVDIENYLIIDKETGRKMINPETDYRMNDFLNTLNNPLADSPIVSQCFGLDRMLDFEEIQNKFYALGREYTHIGKK